MPFSVDDWKRAEAAWHAKRDDEFPAWVVKVDAAVSRKVGLSIHDLPDVNLRDWYDEGMSPSKAASLAIKSAKGDGLY